jgi:hypothetical protein
MRCQNCKKLECTQPYELCEKGTRESHLADITRRLKDAEEECADLRRAYINEATACDSALQKVDARLELAEKKNRLYVRALETLKVRHFPKVRLPETLDTWENGKSVPGAHSSFWLDSREAFALLDEKYLKKKLEET